MDFLQLDGVFDRLPDQGQAYALLFAAKYHGGGPTAESLRRLLGLVTIDETMRFVVHRIAQPRPHYDRLVALHEAAHAVACVVFRQNLRYVAHRPENVVRDGWAVVRGWEALRRQLDG